MSSPDTARDTASARTLSLAAYASFVPIGIATVLLGPMLPTLSARWSLNYSQAGALFNAQFFASSAAVLLSGWIATRWGYRFAMESGLLLMAAGVAFLLSGPKLAGILCIAAYGAGSGLAVPAANLLVAEVNPNRRSAALNILNFCWSMGAVVCPFLVAIAVRQQRLQLMLGLVAGLMFVVLIGIAIMPASVAEPAIGQAVAGKNIPRVDWSHRALLPIAILFLLYVGTESGFGGWVATYSKSLGNLSATTSLITPSFFYFALTIGRWLAPLLLKLVGEIRLAQAGLIVACAGMGGLMASHALPGVVVSASVAGLGLSSVYPITISFLSKEFGPAAARVGSVMFTLSNVGAGLIPWLVGVVSTHFGTLKVGLALPVLGAATMYVVYLGSWKAAGAQSA